jgi:hypothetical protein
MRTIANRTERASGAAVPYSIRTGAVHAARSTTTTTRVRPQRVPLGSASYSYCGSVWACCSVRDAKRAARCGVPGGGGRRRLVGREASPRCSVRRYHGHAELASRRGPAGARSSGLLVRYTRTARGIGCSDSDRTTGAWRSPTAAVQSGEGRAAAAPLQAEGLAASGARAAEACRRSGREASRASVAAIAWSIRSRRDIGPFGAADVRRAIWGGRSPQGRPPARPHGSADWHKGAAGPVNSAAAARG